LIQVVMFLLLARAHSYAALAARAFVVLFCYGGGFGAMPAFAADYFGSTNVGSIYGLMLTAWGAAGVLGPSLFAAIRQRTGHYTLALDIVAGIMFTAALIPLLVRPPKDPGENSKTVSNESLLSMLATDKRI